MAERSGPVASVTGLVIPPVNFFKIFCLVKYLHIISLEIVDHLKCPLRFSSEVDRDQSILLSSCKRLKGKH